MKEMVSRNRGRNGHGWRWGPITRMRSLDPGGYGSNKPQLGAGPPTSGTQKAPTAVAVGVTVGSGCHAHRMTTKRSQFGSLADRVGQSVPLDDSRVRHVWLDGVIPALVVDRRKGASGGGAAAVFAEDRRMVWYIFWHDFRRVPQWDGGP